MKLDPRALAKAGGVVMAAVLFLATFWIVITGGEGLLLGKLGRFYLGYRVSVLGSLIGAVYGFLTGYLGGWSLAVLYNRFASRE